MSNVAPQQGWPLPYAKWFLRFSFLVPCRRIDVLLILFPTLGCLEVQEILIQRCRLPSLFVLAPALLDLELIGTTYFFINRFNEIVIN
jgi:hypothetical protein